MPEDFFRRDRIVRSHFDLFKVTVDAQKLAQVHVESEKRIAEEKRQVEERERKRIEASRKRPRGGA